MSRAARVRDTALLMEPVDGNGAKRPLQRAREPLSLRFLLAFSAATVLTAAVAVPMAFQAHLAREDQRAEMVEGPPSAVLSVTTTPLDGPRPAVASGLVHAETPDGPRASLDGAVVTGPVHLYLELPDVRRVDFVLNDEAVVTDDTHPWQPDVQGDGRAIDLPPGLHALTATVTFDDGEVDVRRATFTVRSD